MGLLIRGGEVVTGDARYVADIWCEDQSITAIGRDLSAPGAEVVDATGKYVFPGFIDPHVHIHLPFMGTCAKDTHASASQAALLGGTTTFLEMICPHKSELPADAFEVWSEKARGASACDYSFHMGVTRFDEMAERQLREIVAAGITSFKVFLAYEGAFDLDDRALYQTLRLARELDVIVTAHCENAVLISQRQRELLADGNIRPAFHEVSRPVRVEAEGVTHLMTFAELTGARVYIVHLSCEDALQAALAARDRGVDVTVETLIQYLVLDRSYAELPNFEGAKYVMSPPLRDRRHQPVLWQGLRHGSIQTVATDHAPFDFLGQKEMGRHDFTRIPNGIPSLQDRITLLYTHGVLGGQLSLPQFVDVASTNAAKTFGLFPRKGTIQVGADADLVVFDPEHRGTISAATHRMNVDYSAFEGWSVCGRADVVTVRGQIQVQDGRFVGNPAYGQLLRRGRDDRGPASSGCN